MNAGSVHDPVTRRRYGYRAIDSTSYQPCADFQSDTHDEPAPDGSEFWRHGIGLKGFQMSVPTPAPGPRGR